MPGITQEDWQIWTAAPRQYGFHGTLKPPFRLAAGVTLATARTRVQDVAAAHAQFALPTLEVKRIGRFLALAPSMRCPALNRLAAACVTTLDPLRAPPSTEELDKHRQAGLTPQQDTLLERWGYPYVLDEFRFHLTLTSPLQQDQLLMLTDRLSDYFADACQTPLSVDALALYTQIRANAPFRLVKRFVLGSP